LLPIHGWVFRPEEDSRRRQAALAILHRLLRLRAHDPGTEMLDRRARAFLVDNLGDKRVTVRVGGVDYSLPPSGANGHFYEVLRLPTEIVAATGEPGVMDDPEHSGDRWIPFAAVLPATDSRQAGGAVHLLPDGGLSVISDIDDTIKVTHVGRRRKLLRQTFTREFEAVEGMAELYARWQAAGAAFHYVSRSPWQLYEPLAEFTATAGFPRGAFHLRHFRWREGHTLRADADRDLKQRIIHEMITNFPRRRFVLVGDSGERDPEVYADLARAFPEQIQAVLIRNSSGESARSERFSLAFDGVPRAKWQDFDDPRELTELRLPEGFS
ncbi:MAG TPA: App1 family protein, partial [Pirellulales bacterium]